MNAVIQSLAESQITTDIQTFRYWANFEHLDESLKPGRYEITRGMSVFGMVRMLQNNRQKPVKLVITKIRTREQLAAFLGKRFESDSAAITHYLNQNESLHPFGLDTNNFMTGIFPDTYEFYWTARPEEIFPKLFGEQKRFWTAERKQKAAALKLTPTSAYILASIVEEESNALSEKDTIASVYLNRLEKRMPLQADPTVKFALKDFGLKRIYRKHLEVNSPYNTYKNYGLPPGPICTPSLKTLEAVLEAPKTNYLYFVAKSDFSGTHVFSDTYARHLINARAFQAAQDEQLKIRNAKVESTRKK